MTRAQLVLFVAAYLVSGVLSRGLATDARALLAWKSSWRRVPALIDKGSSECAPWAAGTLPCPRLNSPGGLSWCGVWCGNGYNRVAKIYLVGLPDFEGTITRALVPLDRLKNLTLADLPGFYGDLGTITNAVLTKLPGFRGYPSFIPYDTSASLVLSKLPGLTGQWPPAMAQLTALLHLDLKHCSLSGPMPKKAQLPPLALEMLATRVGDKFYPRWMYLDFSGNRFSGPLPGYGNTFVSGFSVANNQLAGPLPRLKQMPSAYGVVDFSYNGFEGHLPADWANISCVWNIFFGEQFCQPLNMCLNANPKLRGQLPKAWAADNSVFTDRNNSAGLPLIRKVELKPDTDVCGPVPKALEGIIYDARGNALSDLGSCTDNPVQPPVEQGCPDPPGQFCSSAFFSLPRVAYEGKIYILAFPPTRKDRLAAANSFCQVQGFAQAGAFQGARLPQRFVGSPGNWSTYDPATNAICSRPRCPAFTVVECVRPGYQPMQPDAANNLGCGSGGSNNWGNWNINGSNNLGSCNSGSNNRGNGNSGSNNWGDWNTRSNFFGSYNRPWGSGAEVKVKVH